MILAQHPGSGGSNDGSDGDRKNQLTAGAMSSLRASYSSASLQSVLGSSGIPGLAASSGTGLHNDIRGFDHRQRCDFFAANMHDHVKKEEGSDGHARIGLNLGVRTFSTEDTAAGRLGKSHRAGSPGSQVPMCQAEGCKADLSTAKDYHRRHKVCEFHSKKPTVIVGAHTLRFCQQCSRFHHLGEFDEGKRSCRKRLADHNRRRRKPQPNASTSGGTPAESIGMKTGDDVDLHSGSNRTNDQKSMLNIHLQKSCGSPSSVSLEDSDDQKPGTPGGSNLQLRTAGPGFCRNPAGVDDQRSGMQMQSPPMTGSEAQALLSAMSLSPPVPLMQQHNTKRQLTMLAGTGDYDHGSSVYQQYLQAISRRNNKQLPSHASEDVSLCSEVVSTRKDFKIDVSGLQDLIGDNLVIDLSRDLLSVSSSGYVIRTSFTDGHGVSQPCILKRCDVVGQSPPDLGRLQHPHVVHLIGFWIEEKYLFLVMEVLDGDLGKLILRTKSATPLSIHVAVDLMLQIAEGMLYLHKMGVSYSLKCDNVLYKLTERNKTEAFRVGDVVLKLGGFGCSSPAQLGSKSQDVLDFGLTCLEILTGNKRSDKIAKSSIPKDTPIVLKDVILSCQITRLTLLEVYEELLLARTSILQTYVDDFKVSSQSMETDTVQTETNCGREEIFAVHQLHPQLGDIPTSLLAVRATLIFFHGFRKVPDEWRRTWMTRDNKLVWPQKWLPEDLVAENIRVLSVSFDENTIASNSCNRHEIGENLVQSLVLSPEWKLCESGEAIFLIGHSFGGVLIKYLVTKARHLVRINIDEQEALKCEKFLERLAKIVFYSVPHASTGQEFENYVSKCKKIAPLKRSSFLQSLEGDKLFVADMNKLSTDFEIALPEKLQILAFLEGKAMSKESVLVTEKSCEGASHSWEWHKIDKDNHFEVCRPNSKEHTGYRILLQHLHQHLNDPYDVTSTLASDFTRVLGKRQRDDLSTASEAFPAKSLTSQGEGSSTSVIVSVTPEPAPEHSTSPDIDAKNPSDRSRENDVKDYAEGGVRFRENLGKFVVEYRPPGFKWKLWMGTYATVHEGRRACDCARFYAGQDKGGFYFKDSPALFAELGPLNRPITLVSRDVKDKAYNVELKRRAKLAIRKDKDSQICTKYVESTIPVRASQSPEPLVPLVPLVPLEPLVPLIREQSTADDSYDESGVTPVRNAEKIGEGS